VKPLNEKDRLLLEEIRQVKRLHRTSKRHTKRKHETESEFIKRKNRYKCTYCTKTTPSSKLHAFLEPYHSVKFGETFDEIASKYNMNTLELMSLNDASSDSDLSKGQHIKLLPTHKVRRKTHGLCSCKSCKDEKDDLELDHVDYLQLVLSRRRQIRDEIADQPHIRKKVFRRDKYQCVYCEIEFGRMKGKKFLTLDHKKPIVKGGTNDIDREYKNLCCACLFHNKDKKAMNYEEYVKKIKERRFHRENSFLPSSKRP
jgi:LysM repeat protein